MPVSPFVLFLLLLTISVLSKKDVPVEKVDLVIFDRTADVSLVLWGSTCASTSTWVPSQTVLYLSGMTFNAGQRPSLSLNQDSVLLVDPMMDEIDWLREHARSLTQHNHVNPLLPTGGTASSTFRVSLC